MKLDELKAQLSNLELSDIGNWPLVAKIGAIAIICLAVLGGGFWFDTRNQWAEYETAHQKENELKAAFEEKLHKSTNLAEYRKQMDEMKRTFGTMLRQLPLKTEIAELLVDISQTGLAAGLEFDLFKPESEVAAEFYMELPIKIRVTGDYHDFGNFVSGVAQLPRIVTLHNISITRIEKSKTQNKLLMEATAKTYRYMEEGAK